MLQKKLHRHEVLATFRKSQPRNNFIHLRLNTWWDSFKQIVISFDEGILLKIIPNVGMDGRWN